MTALSDHFTRKEFQCRCGCGFDTVDIETLTVLEEMREFFNSPITINSGCRCSEYNKKVGGEDNSYHMLGRAADIVVKDIEPNRVQEYLIVTYPSKYGIGRYKTFTHLDTRSNGPARWDLR